MTPEDVKKIATEALEEVNYAEAHLERGFLTLFFDPIERNDPGGWTIRLRLAEKDPTSPTLPRNITVSDGQPDAVKAEIITKIEEKLSQWHDLIYPRS